MKKEPDKKKATYIFVAIIAVWTAYLFLSHDSKAPITKGVSLNSGQMMGVRPDEIREFESVINYSLPAINTAIETTGGFKPSVVLLDSTGKMNPFYAPTYSAFPLETGLRKLVAMRKSKGGPSQIKVIVAFSPGRVKNVIEGRKDAIVIQFLNKDDISQTVTLPYVVKNGSTEYGFIQHFDTEL